MSEHSQIQWTDATWNPVVGCTRISPGCTNCYAIRDAYRMGHNPNRKVCSVYEGLAQYQSTGKLGWTDMVRCVPDRLGLPPRWKTSRRVFVNSQSDLYHKDVPEEFIGRVFETMNRAHWHTYQILTKRAERLEELSPRLPWAPHIWQGVSVENADYTSRIDHLRRTGAHVKFLSVEPLLGPIPHLDLAGIHWVIVGGESGPGCRPMEEEWVHQIREACRRQNVAMFFKQTGEKLARRLKLKSKKGGDADELPAELRVREFPLPMLS